MRNTLVALLTVLLLVLLANTHANAEYLVVLDQSVGRVINAEVMKDSVIILIDSKLLVINLTTAEVYELMMRFNASYLSRIKSSLLSLGILEGSTAIAIFEGLSNVTLFVLKPQFTLYDIVEVGGSTLGTGYISVNNTYKLLLLNLNSSSITSYVAECRVACYGRKVIHVGSNTLVIGSIYLRSDVHGWNYDFFFGNLLDNRYIVGKYVELGGNDFVINAYIIDGLLYVILNSDVGDTYIAIVNPVTYDVTLYKISIDKSPITHRSTARFSMQLLLLVNTLSIGDNYLVVVNTTSLGVNAYVDQRIKSITSIGDEFIVLLTSEADLKTSLHILNTSEFDALLRSYDGVKAYINAIRVRVQDLNLTLSNYSTHYHVLKEGVYMRRLGTATVSPLEVTLNTVSTPKGSTYSKPLYEPRIVSRNEGSNLLFLIVGVVLVTTSIILKYIVIRRDRN